MKLSKHWPFHTLSSRLVEQATWNSPCRLLRPTTLKPTVGTSHYLCFIPAATLTLRWWTTSSFWWEDTVAPPLCWMCTAMTTKPVCGITSLLRRRPAGAWAAVFCKDLTAWRRTCSLVVLWRSPTWRKLQEHPSEPQPWHLTKIKKCYLHYSVVHFYIRFIICIIPIFIIRIMYYNI